MSYIYITPAQKIHLADLEDVLKRAELRFSNYNAGIVECNMFKDIFSINSFKQIKLSHSTNDWANVEANKLFIDAYPLYDANKIFIKWAATLCHVPQYNSQGDNMSHYQHWKQIQNTDPTGDTFPPIYNEFNETAKNNIVNAKNEASQNLSDYRTFLKKQDETKANLSLSQNVTNTVNQFNQAIEETINDPKKLVTYLAIFIIAILSIYFIFKLFNK